MSLPKRKRRSGQHARAIESAAEELRTQGRVSTRQRRHGGAGWKTGRAVTIGLAKLLLLPAVTAAPLSLRRSIGTFEEETPKPANDPQLWLYLGIAVALVLGGGVFAGLTIALMGQDETYLQVLATSGEGAEKKNSEAVLTLLKRP